MYREDILRRWLEGQSPSGPRIMAPCLALQTPTLILYGELDRTLARESLRALTSAGRPELGQSLSASVSPSALEPPPEGLSHRKCRAASDSEQTLKKY